MARRDAGTLARPEGLVYETELISEAEEATLARMSKGLRYSVTLRNVRNVSRTG